MKSIPTPLIALLVSVVTIVGPREPFPEGAQMRKDVRVVSPAPTKPPLQPVDTTKLRAGVAQLDLYLLMGQSNMKGRGVMPAEPKRDPRIVMMHLKDDLWQRKD